MDNPVDLNALGDLGSILSPLLNDPDAMDNLRQAAEQMGLGDLLSGAVGDPRGNGTQQSEPAPPEHSDASPLPTAELLSMVTKLAPLLSAPQEDDTTRLLAALRPFLSQTRLQRLDKAERLLSVTRVLSILKESKLM